MKVLPPYTPLKVVRKLLHKNINIGAEGTLDVFLCDTLEEQSPQRAILMIFIGLYEDISLKLITLPPDSMDDAEAILHEALKDLQACYMQISVQERNQWQRLN